MGKTCALQWIPAHAGFEGNEAETRNLTTPKAMLHSTTQTPLPDIDRKPLSGSLPRINLGVQGETQGGLHRHMQNVEIVMTKNSLHAIFSIFSAILASFQNIGEYPFDDDLYTENIVKLFKAKISSHGSI
ncbi:hypothetical protein TNCV_727851 [Trichonephila clavipes]|nr:hypothetical protein TNCV_727851 [Trichonephila clavipes]